MEFKLVCVGVDATVCERKVIANFLPPASTPNCSKREFQIKFMPVARGFDWFDRIPPQPGRTRGYQILRIFSNCTKSIQTGETKFQKIIGPKNGMSNDTNRPISVQINPAFSNLSDIIYNQTFIHRILTQMWGNFAAFIGSSGWI